ncbi:MAG: xylulokinase [Chloroflexi bacterium]|nr:xylulokinase [Chloroflexota bacterium]
MKYVLGIDIGTTGAKALLVSETGNITASATVNYPLLTPRPKWTEQAPLIWWEATVSAIRTCLEKGRSVTNSKIEVVAIGLTGQMHGSVFLDNHGKVLRPAILWNDQRTESQCREITETVGFNKLIELTFNRALTGFTAPKILWLRQNEPEIYARVSNVLLPKDYIRYRMTGAFATEVSDASGTLLFNVADRRWSEEMLKALDIPRGWLPDCFESPEINSYISKESSKTLGLIKGTPVVGGGGDQAAGAVGNGIVREGLASCVIGTSGVIFWHVDKPAFDPLGRLHSFCHAVPGKWHLMGVTLSAGGALRWFRDALCHDEIREAKLKGMSPYEIIDQKAASVPAGSEGLVFLPYLAGERTPYADANARGAFLGLSLRHTKAHMARAVLEGVTMSLKDCLELGRELGVSTTKIYLSGGGAKSVYWQQLAADIFETEVVRIGVDEGPAYGASILAAVGVGLFKSVEEACANLIHTVDSKSPDSTKSQIYRYLYALYQPLPRTLKDFFDRDAAFVEGTLK